MKKVLPVIMLAVSSFICFASCSKKVKAPAKVAAITTSTSKPTTSTQPGTQDQGGHICGGGHTSSNPGGSY